jgi:hypothetical protein
MSCSPQRPITDPVAAAAIPAADTASGPVPEMSAETEPVAHRAAPARAVPPHEPHEPHEHSRKERLKLRHHIGPTLAAIAAALPAAAALAAGAAQPAGASSAAATGAPPPRVLTCGGKPVTKPRIYVLTCADAYTYFDTIHWTSWGATSATAKATYVNNTCTPNCVAGHFVRYPTTLTLSKPEKTKYGYLFSAIHYTYSVSKATTLPLEPLSAVPPPSSAA